MWIGLPPKPTQVFLQTYRAQNECPIVRQQSIEKHSIEAPVGNKTIYFYCSLQKRGVIKIAFVKMLQRWPLSIVFCILHFKSCNESKSIKYPIAIITETLVQYFFTIQSLEVVAVQGVRCSCYLHAPSPPPLDDLDDLFQPSFHLALGIALRKL